MRLSEAIRYQMSIQFVKNGAVCREMRSRQTERDLRLCALCPLRTDYWEHRKSYFGPLRGMGLEYRTCAKFEYAYKRGTKKAVVAMEEIVLALEMQGD